MSQLNGTLHIPQFGKPAANVGTPPDEESPEHTAETVEIGTPPAEKSAEKPSEPPPIREPMVEIAKEIAKIEGDSDPMPTSVDQVLVRILAWKRPHDTAGEQNFVKWLEGEVKRRGGSPEFLAGGNMIVTINHKRGKSKKAPVPPTVMFSCHTDTVHSDCNGDQQIMYDQNLGHIILGTENPGSCLGADDGAGIWLCLEMISAKVPGTYVFHRGEERGGIGSRTLLQEKAEWLQRFDLAIAFDRKGRADVITMQGGQECASEKCGLALSKALNELQPGKFHYKICQNGSFTDTKVYRGVIPECFNLSVGYDGAHSRGEFQDYRHLLRLRDALVKLDWYSLPIDRDEKSKPSTMPYYRGGGYQPGLYDRPGQHGFGGLADDMDDADTHFAGKSGKGGVPPMLPPVGKSRVKTHSIASVARTPLEPFILDELRCMTADEIQEVADEPDSAFSVITALYAELEAAYAKVQTFKALAGID